MEVVLDEGVQQSRREGVFRRGSRKRSPMAEAGIRLVRGKGAGRSR